MERQRAKDILLWVCSILFFGLLLGTTAHEIIGHGLPATVMGYQITDIQILFLQITPVKTSFIIPHSFGSIFWNVQNPSPKEQVFLFITPAILALLVAITATLFFLRGYRYKKILAGLSLWFIDPLNNHILWRSLDYKKLLATGYPVIALQVFTLLTSLIILTIFIFLFLKKQDKKRENIFQKILLGCLTGLIILVIYTFSWNG